MSGNIYKAHKNDRNNKIRCFFVFIWQIR